MCSPQVEEALGLPVDTVKIGLMDEERRTSVNLQECIRAARSRIAFINTGFLDRTGDEIHTSMHGGPDGAQGRHEVAAVAHRLRGQRTSRSGWPAVCAAGPRSARACGPPPTSWRRCWRRRSATRSPEPTAPGCRRRRRPSLHATHYHRVDVLEQQDRLAERPGRPDRRSADHPAGRATGVDAERDVRRELDNNAQGILGYVVRWVDQGIGCSKVPDIDDIALMEDRATCRISSQHIANWLLHGVVDRDEVIETMRRMAAVVDRQNAGDPAYRPMAPDLDGPAFRAACELVLQRHEQPSGYTEPILHRFRREQKQLAAAPCPTPST